MNNTAYFSQIVQAVDGILQRLRCYRDTNRIRNDALDVLKGTPSLQPRVGAIAKTNPNQILYLQGTIPIIYNNAQYNIPVTIWLVEAYPFSPPVPYVTPTPDMIIKPKHKHVDSQGMCYFPYLSNWNPNNCNLVGLIQVMSKAFGDDPPVRAQSKQASATPTPTTTFTPSATSTATSTTHAPYNATPYPPGSQQQYPYPYPTSTTTPSYGQPLPTAVMNTVAQQPSQGPTLPPKQPFENPAEVVKRNAVRTVTEITQGALHDFNTNTTKDIDELMSKTQIEEDKARKLDAERERLLKDLAQVDVDIEDVTKRFEDITQWLDHNDNSNKAIDIDAVTDPREPLAKQLLTLVAEDATIEDTLYYLEKALGHDNLNAELFLKSFRALSAEQFLKRATIKKIHEKQRGM